MKNNHVITCKTVSVDDALSSLRDGSCSFQDLAHLLLSFRKKQGHTYAPRLYAYVLQHGLETHTSIGNYLVSMLVENGNMGSAHHIFDRLAHPNECSWNSLIIGYVKFGKPEYSLILFKCREEILLRQPHAVIALLQACAKLNDLEKGIDLHNKIMGVEMLETSLFVGGGLVDMYAKCGCLSNAQHVFDKLPYRDVFIWTALIKGYVEHTDSEIALHFFEQMQCEGVLADPVTLRCVLKACCSREGAKKGQLFHVQIRQQDLLDSNLVIGSAIVEMYAKSGSFAKAQQAFEEITYKNVVTWNILLQGYVDHGYDKQALECFEQMQTKGFCPGASTFLCCLKACIGLGAADKGQELHAKLHKLGLLEQNLFIGTGLVDMYGKFGLLAEAQKVFDKLESPNVISWTALIREYAEHGFGKKALLCFERMQVAGVVPNTVTFVSILLACGSEGAIHKGLEVHAEIGRRGLLPNMYIGSALVDLYSKCGLLTKACEVFDRSPVQDVVVWNTLVSGYTERGHGEEALNCFERMEVKGISPNDVTYLSVVKACGCIGAAHKGIELHATIERRGVSQRTPHIGGALISMYANCFLLAKAQDVFEKLPYQDLVSWNALVSGYTEKGYGEQALECYEQMQVKGVRPDAATFISTLKACASLGAADKSRELLLDVERQKLLEKDIYLGNILVYTLAKCNLLTLAEAVFDRLPVRTVVTWTALTAGLTQHGHNKQAFQCFERMQLEGVGPNALTYASTLKACGCVGHLGEVQELHSDIERQGLLDDDLVIGSILIDTYASFDQPLAARQVFDMFQVHDVASWTALIAALSEHGQDKEALICFEQMQLEGVFPDALSLVTCLRVCGKVGALDKGEEIHSEIERRGLVVTDRVVGNTLVDMYAKCGLLAKAQKVFEKLPARDVVSWTAMIAGYAQLGYGENACVAFHAMRSDGIKPDPITFLVLLSACSCSGLINDTQTYFEAMSEEYGIVPDLKHQACVIDGLGRAGQVRRVVAMMVQGPPLHGAVAMWQTVLSTCRTFGNVDFGQHAFEISMQSDEGAQLGSLTLPTV